MGLRLDLKGFGAFFLGALTGSGWGSGLTSRLGLESPAKPPKTSLALPNPLDAPVFCVHFPTPGPPFILPVFFGPPPPEPTLFLLFFGLVLPRPPLLPPSHFCIRAALSHYRSKSMSSVTVLVSSKPRQAA